jgi:L-threonylcarbamoyladenylate synthase
MKEHRSEPPRVWRTEVLRADEQNALLQPPDLARAVEFLQQGWPVGLPTETVYGLAALALDESACAKVFAAKERPWTDPLICHVAEGEWLDRLAVMNPLAWRLAEVCWPGPLTMVLPKRSVVPDLVTAGQPTVAVRIPSHPVFQQVLRALDQPLAAPSANRFGCVSPTTAEHVLGELEERIPLVVDGGPCGVGLESTIVAVAENHLRILRRGPIGPEFLQQFARVMEPESKAPAEQAMPVVPGGLPWHYAPQTQLRLRSREAAGEPPARSGLLSWRGTEQAGWERVEVLSAAGDNVEAGRNFYAALRRLDGAGLAEIQAELLPEEGLGKTINERLRKAAARGDA